MYASTRFPLCLLSLAACADDAPHGSLPESGVPQMAQDSGADADLDGSSSPEGGRGLIDAHLDGSALTDAGSSPETVHLVTYNVAGLPEGISSSHPSVNSKLISPLLNAYQLAMLQEDFSYHQDLVSALTFPFVTSVDTSQGSLGDGLTFLSDYPIADLVRVKWDDCSGLLDPASGSDCLTPKGFASITLDLGNGCSVDVYDLHADAGDGMDDQTARAKNLRQLATYINANSPGHAVIVGGDTNARYSNPADNVAEFADAANLKDVWVELVRAGLRPTPGVPVTCSSTDENDPECERLDKIFYRNAIGASCSLQSAAYMVDGALFVDGSGMQLSDHRPVSVTFAVRR